MTAVLRPDEKSLPVAIMLIHFEVDDYDAWKPLFDQDPAGRAESGATPTRSCAPSTIQTRRSSGSSFLQREQAKTFREKLLASGALERGGRRIKSGPTVAEVADEHTY